MRLKDLTSKYIEKTEKVLKEIKLVNVPQPIEEARIRNVFEEARRYLEDAKYYYKCERFEVSLASVSYCEGLLDALRMIGLAEFSW
ncbi:MAG: DUF357 domain-containing protein [Nitrososphaerota archaeon]|nr:DUF357 domain-containing protein [Candidatus Bathyarchaeota archaeon]MDW8048501.1 DUF357 domain-containing protein [Nitrososphaerota archaeon]